MLATKAFCRSTGCRRQTKATLVGAEPVRSCRRGARCHCGSGGCILDVAAQARAGGPGSGGGLVDCGAAVRRVERRCGPAPIRRRAESRACRATQPKPVAGCLRPGQCRPPGAGPGRHRGKTAYRLCSPERSSAAGKQLLVRAHLDDTREHVTVWSQDFTGDLGVGSACPAG